MRKEISAITEGLLQNRKTSINEMSGPEFLKKMESNSTFKKMSSLCKKYGYYLQEACIEKYSERLILPYIAISKIDHNDYHSEIYYQSKEKEFKIQTTSYGSLDIKEYEKYMKQIKD